MKALSAREWEKVVVGCRHFQGHGRGLLGAKSLHRKIKKSKYWSVRGFSGLTSGHVAEACRAWSINLRTDGRRSVNVCDSCGVIETTHESGTCKECRP